MALWAAFGFGIAVSLAANIAAAPSLEWQPVLVAGWPPVALLLAVELLAHHPTPAPVARPNESYEPAEPATSPALDAASVAESSETGTDDDETAITLVPRPTSAGKEPTAEESMWAHYQRERAAGRTLTGAELDRGRRDQQLRQGGVGPLAPFRQVGGIRRSCGCCTGGAAGRGPRDERLTRCGGRPSGGARLPRARSRGTSSGPRPSDGGTSGPCSAGRAGGGAAGSALSGSAAGSATLGCGPAAT